VTGITDIVAALAGWPSHDAPLIGVFESQTLEFKLAPYQLGEDPGRAEFAKDICAMANGGGGLIVVGIETERDPDAGRDKSVRVRPLAAGSVRGRGRSRQQGYLSRTARV